MSHQTNPKPPAAGHHLWSLCLPGNPLFPRNDCSELSTSWTIGLISHYMVLVSCMYCVGLWVDARWVPVDEEIALWPHCYTSNTSTSLLPNFSLGYFIFLPVFTNVMPSSSRVGSLSPGKAALKGTFFIFLWDAGLWMQIMRDFLGLCFAGLTLKNLCTVK